MVPKNFRHKKTADQLCLKKGVPLVLGELTDLLAIPIIITEVKNQVRAALGIQIQRAVGALVGGDSREQTGNAYLLGLHFACRLYFQIAADGVGAQELVGVESQRRTEADDLGDFAQTAAVNDGLEVEVRVRYAQVAVEAAGVCGQVVAAHVLLHAQDFVRF